MAPEIEDPQAIAAEAEIDKFRAEHSAALYDPGDPQHSRLSAELSALYEKRWPSDRPENVVVDEENGLTNAPTTLDKIAEEAVAPLTANQFAIDRPRKVQSTCEQSPAPRKIIGKARCSGKVSIIP